MPSVVGVTGASGFVGRYLCAELNRHGHSVRALSRGPASARCALDYDDPVRLRRAFEGCTALVHLAARAHVRTARAADLEVPLRAANVELSLRVAEAALAAGVPRLVFVSSIGAVCSSTELGQAVSENSPCHPTTSYGRSKREAECALEERLRPTGTTLVVVRPPLVHGKGAPGSLASLRAWIDAGRLLPLASVRNRRSLVHVANLAEALRLCATRPEAAGRTYHIRDPRDWSTPELIRELATACGRPARLFSCPSWVLRLVGRVAGQSDPLAQITASLQVDDTRLRTELNFVPVDRAIEA
jgi:UDP-glucose 4-epimerase